MACDSIARTCAQEIIVHSQAALDAAIVHSRQLLMLHICVCVCVCVCMCVCVVAFAVSTERSALGAGPKQAGKDPLRLGQEQSTQGCCQRRQGKADHSGVGREGPDGMCLFVHVCVYVRA